jgi:hypothetical protein
MKHEADEVSVVGLLGAPALKLEGNKFNLVSRLMEESPRPAMSNALCQSASRHLLVSLIALYSIIQLHRIGACSSRDFDYDERSFRRLFFVRCNRCTIF